MLRQIRIAKTVVQSKFRSKVLPTEISTLDLRVWLFETDIRYVNNVVFLFYFELGRWDMIYRSPWLDAMKTHNCAPITTAQFVRIRRPLTLFKKCTIHSRLASWDEKWLYIEHAIFSEGQFVASGVCKGLFKSPEGPVATRLILEKLGVPIESPPLAPEFAAFDEVESSSLERWKNLSNAAILK